MGFDSDQARKFIDLGDRDIAPFFAGRIAEIRHFESAFNTLGWEEKRTAAFRIFQGAPGCGKTSLVEHLRQRHSDDTLFVDIRRGHLASEEALLRQIRQTAISVGSLTGKTIAAFGQAVGAYLRVTRPGGDEARNFVADHATRNAKVVLFMDEAQLVGEDQQPGLGLLHTSGLGFPTVAVFAGLSHTSGRLRSIGGLSRLPDNAIANMGAMRESECAESTARLLDAYGAVGNDSEKERACSTVARLSRGWPQHLQVYLQASYQVLLNQDVPDFDGADLDGAIRSGDMKRASYYAARVSASHVPIEIVAALHERMSAERGISAFDARRLIGDTVDQLAGRTKREWAIRFDDSTENCFAALLRAGVVARDPWDRCTSPIPSFSRYILEQ